MYQLDPVKSHSTYTLGWRLWGPCRAQKCQNIGVLLSATELSTLCCPQLSLASVSSTGRIPRFCHVFTPITLCCQEGSPVNRKSRPFFNYLPWDSSSFSENLFLKQSGQMAFWGTDRKMSTPLLSPAQLRLPRPSVVDQNSTLGWSQPRHNFCKSSSQKRKRITLCLSSMQGVIPTKPLPFFLGKCKVSCGLFTHFGENEMSAVTLSFLASFHLPYHFASI